MRGGIQKNSGGQADEEEDETCCCPGCLCPLGRRAKRASPLRSA